MAPKNDNLDKKQKRELEKTLKQLGLDGRYLDLIHDAIINDWSANRFVTRLVRDDRFQRQFPGLVQGGDINDFLAGKENQNISADSLRTAINNYGQLWQSYESVGKRYGYGKLGKKQVAALIKGEISPDEFGRRTSAVQKVKANPELFDFLKRQAAAAGIKQLQQKDLFRFAAGVGDQKFYDIYDAARFQQQAQGMGFNADQAKAISQALPNTDAQSQSTGFGNVDALITELRATLSDIGPELAAEGITGVDVAKFIASGGTSNPALTGRLEQLVANKRGRGAYVAGQQIRKGPGGGVATYADEGSASYG